MYSVSIKCTNRIKRMCHAEKRVHNKNNSFAILLSEATCNQPGIGFLYFKSKGTITERTVHLKVKQLRVVNSHLLLGIWNGSQNE